MQKINIGIVGIGMIFEFHMKGFGQSPNISIVGCTRDFYGDEEQRATHLKDLQKIANSFGIRAYENFDEMVSDPALDALVITSINPYHYDHIMKALDSGKHVLVEKPVVTELEQLTQIKKKAEEKGLVVFPSHNFVYKPAVQAAKRALDENKLGTILYSQFISCFRLSAEHAQGWRANAELSQGGALMDSGHHQVYQLLYLLGVPDHIQCFTSKMVLTNMESEDFAMINAQYADGSIANIGQGHSSEYGNIVDAIKIVGTEGNLMITDACYVNGEKVEADADYGNSFAHQAACFVEAISKGTQPLSDLGDAANTLKMIKSAYKSAGDRCMVSLH